ncbi:MAG TPA: DUF815 domain-containing protein, partial [Burkholderiaceae bacterium]|nr:DUF815 domain-containing protein [Burkholderiaceae bacterium]
MSAPSESTAAERQLQRLVQWLEHWSPVPPEPDWNARAFQWRKRKALGTDHVQLVAVRRIASIAPEDLLGVEVQKAEILRNTEQFVRGLPANNVLLTGARGTGKSSLVRACLQRFGDRGLRLIEVDKADLV